MLKVIEFTNHAKRKIKQRNLKEKWIKETVLNPEFVKNSYQNRQIAYKRYGKLYLKVVFVKEGDKIIVLTAHFEKGAKLPS